MGRPAQPGLRHGEILAFGMRFGGTLAAASGVVLATNAYALTLNPASLAFGALARCVLVAAKRPPEGEGDAPSRVLMRAKSNIGPDGGGFEYELRQHDLDAYPGIAASRVEWGAAIEGTAREILGEAESAGGRDNGDAVTSAAIFLRATLADGPMKVSEVRANAEGAGLSWASVRRAKDAVGVLAKRVGFGPGGEWEWSLPTP